MAVSKSWFGTLNNYSEEEWEDMCTLRGVTKGIVGKEVGESGTPHLQIWLTFKTAKRLAGLKKINSRAHWEVTKADRAAEKYCKKEGQYFEYNNTEQGKRSDLISAIEALEQGGIMKVVDEHPDKYVKYYRGLERLEQMRLSKKINTFTKTSVVVIIGAAGTGKTRMCYEKHPELYRVPAPQGDSVWFDGYTGQKAILLDDFKGWIKYTILLQWLDGYALQVPIKGGFVWRQWDTVYITSNYEPERWYPGVEDLSALRRRFECVIRMGDTLE